MASRGVFPYTEIRISSLQIGKCSAPFRKNPGHGRFSPQCLPAAWSAPPPLPPSDLHALQINSTSVQVCGEFRKQQEQFSNSWLRRKPGLLLTCSKAFSFHVIGVFFACLHLLAWLLVCGQHTRRLSIGCGLVNCWSWSYMGCSQYSCTFSGTMPLQLPHGAFQRNTCLIFSFGVATFCSA